MFSFVNNVILLLLRKVSEKFVEGMDYEAFKEDDKTSSAVVRKFEIIGEASKNVPSEIKQKHSNILPPSRRATEEQGRMFEC